MTSREQFEQWFSDEVNEGMKVSASGGYENLITQTAWMSWLASRAAIEFELPEPCSPGDFCIDIPAQAHHEVIEAIENAGLKVKK